MPYAWLLLVDIAMAQGFTPVPDALIPVGTLILQSPLAVGDVNNDGVGDLVWTFNSGLYWASGQPGAAPTTIPNAIPMGGETAPTGLVAAVDLNLDGYDDIATWVGAGTWMVWSGADIASGPQWTLDAPPDIARAIGDVNGDGNRDLAIGGTIWLSAVVGPVAGPVLPDVAYLFDAGDVDGDGYDDVVGPEPVVGWYGGGDSPLHLYLGGQTGPSTSPLWSYQGTGQSGWTVCLADVDADGTAELISANLELQDESASGEVAVLNDLANPLGPTVLNATSVDFDIGAGFELGALDDRDGDGAEDVLMAWSGRVQEIPWSLASGFDLASGADEWLGPPGSISSMRTADVDGGGRDLSVSWHRYDNDNNNLTVWLGPGGGSPTDTDTPGDTGIAPDELDAADDKRGGCGCDAGGVGAGWWVFATSLFLRRRR
jgi:hypothetical protein